MNAPPSGARQVSVAPERLARWLAGFGERHGQVLTARTADTIALTGADGARAWIDVPFPPLPVAPDAAADLAGAADLADLADAADAADLVAHALRDRRVGVLLVRRGGHAAGLFDGTQLVASKVGSTYVQGTTKAGGWSQQRYARRRANQADAAYAAAADAAARVLAGADLDALVAGGDRDAVRAVLTDRRLAHLEPTGPWLQVKDPKLRVLAATPEQFRAVRIHLDP